jgi:hypothetical protein
MEGSLAAMVDRMAVSIRTLSANPALVTEFHRYGH